MKIAFLFVGQGTQKIGMGQDVYQHYNAAQSIFDNAHTDFDLKKITFEGPESILNDTAYTQVCLLVSSLAIAAALTEEGIIAQGVAGLSLGEYSALTYAQALTLDQAIVLVRQRSQIMANALPQGTSGMSAVLSDQADLILRTLQENKAGLVEIANFNTPSQFVLSGEIDALHSVELTLKEKGITRIIPLKVAGAFHSTLLQDAAQHLKIVLEKSGIMNPKCPVYFNVSGQQESNLIAALTAQIWHSVQWVKTIRNMIEDGYDVFIEIGPGKTLANMVRQINPSVQVYSVESFASIERLKGELNHE